MSSSTAPPENLLIINQVFDDVSEESTLKEVLLEPIPLPRPDEFSFSSLKRYAENEFNAVDCDIKNITEKLSNALSLKLDEATEKQNRITERMVRLEKKVNSTLSETTLRITSTQNANKELNSKLHGLAENSESLYDTITRITAKINAVEAQLPESDRLGRVLSNHATQYPKLHKLLTHKITPQSLPHGSRLGKAHSTLSLTLDSTSDQGNQGNQENLENLENVAEPAEASSVSHESISSDVTPENHPLPLLAPPIVDTSEIPTTSATDLIDAMPGAESDDDNASTISTVSAQSVITSSMKSLNNWRPSWMWSTSERGRAVSSSMSISSNLSDMTAETRSEALLRRIMADNDRIQSSRFHTSRRN